jgi:hypothetical protein
VRLRPLVGGILEEIYRLRRGGFLSLTGPLGRLEDHGLKFLRERGKRGSRDMGQIDLLALCLVSMLQGNKTKVLTSIVGVADLERFRCSMQLATVAARLVVGAKVVTARRNALLSSTLSTFHGCRSLFLFL